MGQKKLEIVKLRGVIGPTADGQALKKALPLATGVESAQYLYDQAKKSFENAGVLKDPAYQKVLDVFKELVDYKKLAASGLNPWTGEAQRSALENAQLQKALEYIDKLDTSKPIRFDFAVGDKAELIGAFTAEGERLDESSETGMNNLLLAHLAEHQLINHEGVVYKSHSNGEIKTNNDGTPVIANPAELKEIISNEKTGLASYVHKTNPSIKLSSVNHEYVAPVAAPGHDSTGMGGGA